MGIAEIASRLRRDRSGAAAVEFAMVAPFLLSLYLGCTELTLGLSVSQRLGKVAASVGDVATQIDVPTQESLQDVVDLGRPLFEPYDTKDLAVTLTAVWIDENRKATVDCSWTTGKTGKLKKGTPIKVPAGLDSSPNRSILMTVATYTYVPVSLSTLTGPVPLRETSWINPRNGARMTWDGC